MMERDLVSGDLIDFGRWSVVGSQFDFVEHMIFSLFRLYTWRAQGLCLTARGEGLNLALRKVVGVTIPFAKQM